MLFSALFLTYINLLAAQPTDDEIEERKKFLLIDGTKYYKE